MAQKLGCCSARDDGPMPLIEEEITHPPIHPTCGASKKELTIDEWSVYKILCEHYLAQLSKDATFTQTIVQLEIQGEIFVHKSLKVESLNWMEYYSSEAVVELPCPKVLEG